LGRLLTPKAVASSMERNSS